MPLSIYNQGDYGKFSNQDDKTKFLKTHWVHKDGHISKKHAIGKLLNKWVVTRGIFKKVFGIDFAKTVEGLSQKRTQVDQTQFNNSCDFLIGFIQSSDLKEKKKIDLINQVTAQKFQPQANPNPTTTTVPESQKKTPPKPPLRNVKQKVEPAISTPIESESDKGWFEHHFSRPGGKIPEGYKAFTQEEIRAAREFSEKPGEYLPKIKPAPGRWLRPLLGKNGLETVRSLQDNEWLTDDAVKIFGLLLLNRLAESGKNYDEVFILDPQVYIDLYKEDYNFSVSQTELFDRLPKELFSQGKLLIPIHQKDRSHWTLVQVDFDKKKITSYDSLGHQSNKETMDHVGEWMDYWREQKGLSKVSWEMEDASVPKQNNGSDCGAFVCSFMETICQDVLEEKQQAEFKVKAENMDYYRFYLLDSLTKAYVKKSD